jgi:hypothetical protein
MEQTTFTKRNNAKRAAERMIGKGTAPSIDYKLHELEDGRIEIQWKAGVVTTEETSEDPWADPEEETHDGAEDNGFGPDPWPPGARVRVAVTKRKIRTGTVDYQVDEKYWRVFLDGPAKYPTSTEATNSRHPATMLRRRHRGRAPKRSGPQARHRDVRARPQS